MKISDLSVRLQNLAENLHKHSDKLTNPKFITTADKFLKTLTKFEDTLSKYTKDQNPDAVELKALMQGYFSSKPDATTSLGFFAKKVLGKKIASNNLTPEEYLTKIFDEIVKKDNLAVALKFLKSISSASVLDLNVSDELALLEQIRKLGALDEEALEVQSQILLSNLQMLYKLADVAKVKYKKSSRPETIFKKIVDEGKRYYENTGVFEVTVKQSQI